MRVFLWTMFALFLLTVLCRALLLMFVEYPRNQTFDRPTEVVRLLFEIAFLMWVSHLLFYGE